MLRLSTKTLATTAVVLMAAVLMAPTSQAATVDVDISGFTFVPDTLVITAGDEVKWTNQDVAPHTSTSDAPLWDSGTLNQGQFWSRTFNTPGSYPYHCAIHPSMQAVIIVEAAPVPGLSAYGTALLILLLVIAAYFVYRRKQSAIPA
ncbi:MAG: cupredoxin family copper-binding protein [candidate division Zixibacteria bacterium]|nr:cupredoxin family copper-binding protein [candidate division Zixibacteria bacterium]MDH3938160.1 cupredoxin family copper-binding protein [candidate division Zixibacteria bacterium]MDH4033535.1 cupredoxin family copper-binding protein [candidate division Zixibacteria bacterium]